MKVFVPLIAMLVACQMVAAQTELTHQGEANEKAEPEWLICMQNMYRWKEKFEGCIAQATSECMEIPVNLAQEVACLKRRRDILERRIEDFSRDYLSAKGNNGDRYFEAELVHSKRLGEVNCDFFVAVSSNAESDTSTPKSLRAFCEFKASAETYSRVVLTRSTPK